MRNKRHLFFNRRRVVFTFIAINLFILTGCELNLDKRPNIILIVIDCLRADHVGAYGYDRPTTPNLDRFAKQAVRFDHAITQATWTLPSISSIITGLTPLTHQVSIAQTKIPQELTTIPEFLQQAGYDTGAIGTCGFTSREFNFDQGFSYFDETLIAGRSNELGDASKTLDHAIKYIKQVKNKPFFIYIHLYDPHESIPPPKDFQKHFGNKRIDLYDGSIAFTDQEIGRFFHWLKKKRLWKNSTIIVTADHGEELGERGRYGHGQCVYHSLCRVPLLIRTPNSKTSAIPSVVGLIDLAPTILEIAGESFLDMLLNPDLAPAVRHDKNSPPNLERGKISHARINWGEKYEWIALVTDSWKLIVEKTSRREPELYYLRGDPNETNNLAGTYPDVAEKMFSDLQRRIDLYRQNTDKLGISRLEQIRDPRIIQNLRNLGYLN